MKQMKMGIAACAAALVGVAASAPYLGAEVKDPAAEIAALQAEVAALKENAYVIGLGEIMGAVQVRHGKLWFAGDMQNWDLAAYEMDELQEGFDDAMKFHPNHHSVPRPLTEMMPEYMDQAIADLRASIEAKDHAAFVEAFEVATASCNACHTEANFGFNVVVTPTTPPYDNQSFAP
jgi:hypothetical protein